MPIALAWLLVVDDTQRDQLEKELRLAIEALDRERRRLESGGPYKFGPVVFRTSLRLFSIVYAAFDAACFAAGVTFVLLSGVFQALGVALIVGSLFSISAFVGQFWDHAWQVKQRTYDRAFDSAYDDVRYAELQRLAKAAWEISEQIKSLRELVPPEYSNGRVDLPLLAAGLAL